MQYNMQFLFMQKFFALQLEKFAYFIFEQKEVFFPRNYLHLNMLVVR